jgi:hypothetical protein
MASEHLFNVQTPLGLSVRTKRRYWNLNLAKHEAMFGRERDVADALHNPDEVRISRSDAEIFLLFYRADRLQFTFEEFPLDEWVAKLSRLAS